MNAKLASPLVLVLFLAQFSFAQPPPRIPPHLSASSRAAVLAILSSSGIVISPPRTAQNDWRGYGLRDAQGHPNLAGSAFRLLTGELIPWSAVERLEADPRARNLYRFILPDGAQKIVAWGAGDCTPPNGLTQFTSVIPALSGEFHWQALSPGATLPFSPNPILLK